MANKDHFKADQHQKRERGQSRKQVRTFRVEAPKKKPKPLTNRDELSLVWRWQRRKDDWARDALVRAFQPAIRNLARKYPGPGLEFDDLVSLGNMGFLRALDKFDIHRRLRLWTYAHGWVRAEITAGTAKCQSLVHRPRSRGQKKRNLPDVSLNAPVGRGTTELIDLFIDSHPDYEPRYFDREQLAKALKSLGLREQTIFTARWLSDNPVPFPKLAAKFQISAERCRQIGNDAFAAVAARMENFPTQFSHGR